MKIQNIETKLIDLNNLVVRKVICERALKDINNLKRNEVRIYLSVGMNQIDYAPQNMKRLIEVELKETIKKIEELS